MAYLTTVDDYISKGLVHEIHNSERKSFSSCRRRWDWIYRSRYYPRSTPKPLEFGIAYHIGMETYYNPQTWSFPNDVKIQLAKEAFAKECERQRTHAIKNGAWIDADVEADYNERVALGLGMIEYYFSTVSPKVDRGFTPERVEVEFTVKIPHPDTDDIIWCKCNSCETKASRYSVLQGKNIFAGNWKGLPVVFSGRIDMLAKDNEGRLWIYDWKTASQIREDKEWLELDDQVGSYVWALRSIGLDVVGFIYHEQLKGFPKPPQRNSKARNGCMYSVNKSQMTDYETFQHTVANEDTEAWGAGLYDNFLQYLKAEGIKFYDRKEIHKSQEQCDSIAQTIASQALDMVRPSLRIYPSPSRFTCSTCAYKVPCLEKERGGDYTYALDSMFDKRKHYYEILREGTTE